MNGYLSGLWNDLVVRKHMIKTTSNILRFTEQYRIEYMIWCYAYVQNDGGVVLEKAWDASV